MNILAKALNPKQIEVFYFNPSQDGALRNFVSYFSDRLCDHAQKLTFRHGEDSCRLLEYQRPNEQPPRWMLINVMKDVTPVEGVTPVVLYLRSDNCYLSAFSNQKGQIYELVEDDSMRMIEGSLALGFGRDYPSLMNYERPEPIPEGATKKRLLEIILNMENFSHGIEVLSSFDHNILADTNVSEAEKQKIVQEMLEALARNAVVLAEVSRIVALFLSVNQNWKELRSTLTELLFQYVMHWKKMSDKVRTGADDSEDDIILRFRQQAIKLLNLVLNAKGPGAIENRSTAPGDDGKGSEDPGSSGGDDEEQQTPGSSCGLSGPAKDKKLNMPGSGSLDSSDDNLGGGHDGGKQKVHYNDCRPETTETSKVQMAFLTGLIVGKNFVQPMINQRRMKPFVITKRGLELTIISRRSVQALLPDPLESAHGTGLGQVLSLVHDSSTSSRGETSSGPVASSSENVFGGYEELLELILSKTAYVPAVKSHRTSVRRPDLGEVKGLFNASETTLTGSSLEEHITIIPIPSRPIPTGQTLFEIFSVDTNLCLIKTIVLYDDQGGTLVYKSKEGDKDRFIRRRSIWLSKHIGKPPSDFIDSLILRGPTRPMTADAGCWIIEMDVPVESTFGPEDSELCDKIFETTLSLNGDYMDKPRCSLISIRGGFINISSITFSNAVRSTIRFAFDGPLDVSSDEQFKVRGKLTLSVEEYEARFTIFKSQVQNVFIRLVSQTTFEIPLLRHVLALPVGSRVHVMGNLKLGRRKVRVDEYLVLDREIVRAEWPVVPLNKVPLPSPLKARISIELSSFL